MRISIKIDYALRAMAELAASPQGRPVKAQRLSHNQRIPRKFLLAILNELRRAHLVRSQRGQAGGYVLARRAAKITLADVMRAIEGPLANVHDDSLSDIVYPGAASVLSDVWKAVRTSLRSVFEATSIADLAAGKLPRHVRALATRYDAAQRSRAPHGSMS